MAAMELKPFPITRSSPFEPPAEYAKWREEGPLTRVRLWNGDEAWLVTRAQDVRGVMLDKRFSEDSTLPGYPMLSPARKSLLTEHHRHLNMLNGDAHRRHRSVFAKELAVRRIEAMRPFVHALVHKLIDDMEAHGPPIDFVKHFSLKLPSIVISQLLGVPYEDHEFFEDRSARRMSNDVSPEEMEQAGKDMVDYFDRSLRARAANPNPGDDILDHLAHDHIASGAITQAEGAFLAYQLVHAGHETTANMIAVGALLLLNNPEQLQALIADPALAANATEEMLRYGSITQFSVSRVALEDAEIGGQLVRAGEGLYAMLISANHDAAKFPDADKFDIHRGSRAHMAFSFGIHQCIGQHLARVELQEVFSILFQRLPTLHLAIPVEELKCKDLNMVYGFHVMPVSW